MCKGSIVTPWSVPCQFRKCCSCFSRRQRAPPPPSKIQFKPFKNDPDAINQMLKTYELLTKGTYFKPRPRSCPAWTLYIFRYFLFITYLILFFPFVSLALIILFIYWIIHDLVVMIPVGVIMLQCGCAFTSTTSQDHLPTGDQYTIISNAASKEEEKRFDLYVFPIVIFNVGFHVYFTFCRYLAGLLEANLIDDELIIYWLHLWGTSKCHFVYDFDEHSLVRTVTVSIAIKRNEPIRIRGIKEDYSSWVNEEAAPRMFKGMSMEIESVFVDYDDDNRITFKLLNGETVIQPRGNQSGGGGTTGVVDELGEDMRIWNIVKAHWQSQVINYIERRWRPGRKHCSDSVMDRIIRSHSYFTAFLNSAGPADGFCNPQMRRWSLCEFLCAPWKTLPVPTQWIHWLFVSDITAFWFKDSEYTMRSHTAHMNMTMQSSSNTLKVNNSSNSTVLKGPVIVTFDDDQKGVSVDLHVGSSKAKNVFELPEIIGTANLSEENVVTDTIRNPLDIPSPEMLAKHLSVSAELVHKMTMQSSAIRSIQKAMSIRDQGTIQSFMEMSRSPGMQDVMPSAMKSVVSSLKKVADPDSFPPIFIRNRLEMFEEEFDTGKEWIEMHRGWHVYKDFLADYYKIIHEDFVVKLHDAGYLKKECLERWITFMEKEGFPGISKCKRHGGYLHIFSTFLWLNVVHASDHTIANNIVRHWGVNCSVVPMETQQWFREHGDYDYLDVLEGKDCRSRWRIQFYAMRIRVFWGTFGGPWNQGGFHADHMIDGHLHRHFRDIDGITEDERKEIDGIHKGYIRKMKECDVNYRWLMRVEDLTAGIQY